MKQNRNVAHIPVVICGSIPPPVGGVTIHTQRLIDLLQPLDYVTFCDNRPCDAHGRLQLARYLKSMFGCAKAAATGVVHYQSNNWPEACLLVALKWIYQYKIIYTLHSFRSADFGRFKRMLVTFCQKWIDCFIAPSAATKAAFIQSNGDMSIKTVVVDTYIPSNDMPETEISEEIQAFVEAHGHIVLASAWSLYLDKDGIDVYGLDMCIEACRQIENASFLFCIPIVKDRTYYEACIERIQQYGLENRFMLFNGMVSLVALMPMVDAFVRPSSSDSFGISVAEAIDAGVPAVASDVCTRAEGTLLFKARDEADFIEKLRYALSAKHEAVEKVCQETAKSVRMETYRALYNRVGYGLDDEH